jgi:hypothetical protein
MSVQYQIDGNIFREITSHWLCASVKESLIKARQTDAANAVEYVQLSDGRVFSRSMQAHQTVNVPKASARLWSARSESLTQPR